MNQNNNNSKENGGLISPSSKKRDLGFQNRSTEKINLLSSEKIDFFVKNLSSPRFLGSLHMKQEINPNSRLIENVINKNLDHNLSRSLKNPLNNPITKYLILMMILFNFLWIIFIYVL